jgi:hypothetical protein
MNEPPVQKRAYLLEDMFDQDVTKPIHSLFSIKMPKDKLVSKLMNMLTLVKVS